MRTRALFAPVAVLLGMIACSDPQEPTSLAEEAGLLHAPGGKKVEYQVTLLESLGGELSRGATITNAGRVVGFSDMPDGERRAVMWRKGELIPLGRLGGPHNSVVWHGQNDRGMIVGIAQTGELDPTGQRWSCRVGFAETGHVCVGFVWERGTMTALPTLGGRNGFATAINNRGQAVGWAETLVEDPTCDLDFRFLQFRAVVWEPRRGRTEELPPFPGDSASAATAINERGQVVGISGECGTGVGGPSARRAVLWDRGEVIDLGSLGGTAWNTPMAINSRGDVVGFANAAEGEGFSAEAFLWTKRTGRMEPLGTLGLAFSQAHGVNSRGQVVGVYFDTPQEARAFLWDEHEGMRDLTRLAPDYSGILVDARYINERGQITGQAFDPDTGETHAFVATPVPARRSAGLSGS